MKPALVTGATGFLGKHLVEQLLERPGEGRIRLLCRGSSAARQRAAGKPWDQDPRVEVRRGDVASAAEVAAAMEGAGRVYHLAGLVSRHPRDAELLYRVHVEGTRHVCEAALRCGVDKLVVVSSSGTTAVSREPVLHDEDSGYKHEIVGRWPYYLSKIYTEKLALWYARHAGLPVVVVNPSLLLGPGDQRRSSTGDVALFLEGQILAAPLGGLNFVDARDAAAGLIAAMERGRPGERYLLGGVNWTFRQMMLMLGEITGLPAPKTQLSLGVSLAGAALLRRLYPLIGKTYALDAESVRMSALYWYCNPAKARAELGFQFRDPLETLRQTVEDLRRS